MVINQSNHALAEERRSKVMAVVMADEEILINAIASATAELQQRFVQRKSNAVKMRGSARFLLIVVAALS